MSDHPTTCPAKPALALYQPDIPGNAGTLLRLAACLDFPIHVIFPCGFLWDEKRMRRSGMDYLDKVPLTRHADWDDFAAFTRTHGHRLILLSTKATQRFDQCAFAPGDILLMGRESAGVPDDVADMTHIRLRIPLQPGMRSLNVAVAATLVMGEALRQTQGYPP